MTRLKNRTIRLLLGTFVWMLCGSFVVLVVTAIAGKTIRNTYASIITEELRATCAHIGDELGRLYEGDYSVDSSGILMKGDEVLTGQDAILDSIKAKSGVEYALYFGKSSMLTTLFREGTNERQNGVAVADEIYNTVVGQGQDFHDEGVSINGEPFSVYYTPLTQADGTRVGMIFSGRRSFEVEERVRSTAISMGGVGIGLVLVIVAIGFPLALKSSRRMSDMGKVIGSTSRVSGELHSSSQGLFDKTGQASSVSSQITKAVSEVRDGWLSQARSARDAAESTDSLGRDLEDLSENMGRLTSGTEELRKDCEKLLGLIDKMSEKDGELATSIDGCLSGGADREKESARIAEVASEVAEIAEQANILSLDASIEASRAGSFGKGFAQVAGEMRRLADKSRKSAAHIESAAGELTGDKADKAGRERVKDALEDRGRQLSAARIVACELEEKIRGVEESAGRVLDGMEGLNDAKASLTDIINNLNDLAEENARSTEETNASMQELNETFNVISQSVAKLQELSDNLQESISVIQG